MLDVAPAEVSQCHLFFLAITNHRFAGQLASLHDMPQVSVHGLSLGTSPFALCDLLSAHMGWVEALRASFITWLSPVGAWTERPRSVSFCMEQNKSEPYSRVICPVRGFGTSAEVWILTILYSCSPIKSAQFQSFEIKEIALTYEW